MSQPQPGDPKLRWQYSGQDEQEWREDVLRQHHTLDQRLASAVSEWCHQHGYRTHAAALISAMVGRLEVALRQLHPDAQALAVEMLQATLADDIDRANRCIFAIARTPPPAPQVVG